MKPIRDFVLVKPFMADEITEGGLFIPEGFRERSSKAKVISVGRGTAKVKMEAKTKVTQEVTLEVKKITMTILH
jgi:co-chaperonin GroES (HSP10)